MALDLTRPMETVEIASSVAFEAMLKKLNLPCPQYKNKIIGGNHYVELLFYPSTRYLESKLSPHSVMGYSVSSLEEAKNNGARDAILYMETDQKKVLKDYHYDELQRQKKINRRLEHRLEKRRKQIIEAVNACDILMDKVSESNKRIKDIVSKNLALGSAAKRHEHIAGLLDIQTVATELQHHNDKTMSSLKEMGLIPLYVDFPGGYDTPDSDEETDQYSGDDLRFSSDGEERWEEEVLRYDRD